MMRPDTEVPSDFQDYTLVALIGVAVHLSGSSPSEPAVLPTLVRMRYVVLWRNSQSSMLVSVAVPLSCCYPCLGGPASDCPAAAHAISWLCW